MALIFALPFFHFFLENWNTLDGNSYNYIIEFILKILISFYADLKADRKFLNNSRNNSLE